MSHFTVLVACPPGTTHGSIEEALEEILMPFVEHVDPPGDKYAVFKDCTEECRQEYENGSYERIVMPDGTFKYPWDECFRKYDSIGDGANTYKVPEDLERRQVPHKEIYKSFEEFVENWHGYRFDEEQGAYGYYYNPNAKWDWWKLGGRWQGLLTAKPGTDSSTIILGRPGVFGATGDEYTRRDGRIGCDGCRKKDLDFDYEREEKLMRVRSGWEDMVANDHEINAFLRKMQYGFEPGTTLEQELENARNCTPFSTFAMLIDGKWYEKGEMCWFGIVKNGKEREEWCGDMSQLWEEIPDDAFVAVVDCHI